MHKIAIFASGAGSNARQIIRKFKESSVAEVALLVSNVATSGALLIAQAEGIDTLHLSNDAWKQGGREIAERLRSKSITAIALAGFLRMLPPELIAAYPSAILNIHPSLLPLHGGKGMYGMRVHQAVVAAGDAYSGITIHLVNSRYDEGPVLFQTEVKLQQPLRAETVSEQVLALEHRYYPIVLEQYLSGLPLPCL